MAAAKFPLVMVIAGPNGAGKTTVAPALLRTTLGIRDFVNADAIAAKLAGRAPDRAAMAAGREMLKRMRKLAAQKTSFAFETTLASRHFAPWIAGLQQRGYRFELAFLWLPSVSEAIARVKVRVELGGHDVPKATIRRRFGRGLTNFFELYRPLADQWVLIDNSGMSRNMTLIARGGRGAADEILHPRLMERVLASRPA